ncbi:aminopeptidase N [Elongatibacter sediminis]|uniref:Aminopeptidase N n=1 Tax=Elongatibacter sediminis TaxID=3119006 RepID=A0AAW9RKG3_9GAMM
MKEGLTPKIVRREDYTPYPWQITDLRLRFEIDHRITTVTAEMDLAWLGDGEVGAIRLDGQCLELVGVELDGRPLRAGEYTVDADSLVIHEPARECSLRTQVRIRPQENTALEGLYASGEFLLTQCEAEGFRKITYFPDRPDVMTNYEVTLEADRDRYPVLLSNGNAVESGDSGDGRHWVRWCDPFRKPAYLFALVAGRLEHVEDRFTTRSGREVTLRIYVEPQNLDKCAYAMGALIRSMQWDEERFGLEYDLDIYNIVATDDFNMGAMENKSLNIFNSKYVLARPDTATDMDYQSIEGVIGHEYFHNWTGNRVTCRDWFQLTLKEGLTVFRDQEFTSDMQSRAVKRIQDVRDLRTRQFPEDAGPMSHPIRPDRYQEINNFYTMTVYQKGAAVIRMCHTLLGEEGFQKGMRLYFERHDGAAVTCDDFIAAMADANGVDLDRFGRWYSQSGTPEVRVRTEYRADEGRYIVELEQQTPPTHDQSEKQPLLIPFGIGLLTPEGAEIPLRLDGEEAAAGTSRLLVLDEREQRFEFVDVPCRPVPSLLRDFSAPVKLTYDYAPEDLEVLMRHDTDAFVRWEAAQLLAQRAIMNNRQAFREGREMQPDAGLERAFQALLSDRTTDPAQLAETMRLPGEDYLGDLMAEVDVDGLHAARNFTRTTLARSLENEFLRVYDLLDDGAAYNDSGASVARRSLKNVCLGYLADLPSGVERAQRQFRASDNMTDTVAALRALVHRKAPGHREALEQFEKRWASDPLVMDKWFVLQVTCPGADTVERVAELLDHPAFSLSNPNKVRSVVGAFAMLNPTGFHADSGAGYAQVADVVLQLDSRNPQVAARIASAFNGWKRYDESRRSLMRAQLERIRSASPLSADVGEIVGNALDDA